MLGNSRNGAKEHQLGADSRVLCAAPLSHLYGLYSLHCAWSVGACTILPRLIGQGRASELLYTGRAMTADEAKASLADYVAYFGTYTIDERAGTVTHHRQASVQPGELTDYVRNYEFAGDRLILRPVGTKQEVVWERFK